jgi:xanthine dehydrogenase molybdopterin binding subunit/xanthine dehydrogenase small subunit
MNSAIEFVLNGRPVQLADCPVNLTLLEYLRRGGLTGSKEGCAEGDCGACSVAILDRDAGGRAAWRAINSCLMPLCLLDGREIVTVEGVAGPRGLHPVQEKMVGHHGSQCGYCTPGFVLSLFEGYYRGNLRARHEIDGQLCGNLCRCTGYRPILDAALEAFQERRDDGDPFAARLNLPPPPAREAAYDFAGEKFLRPASLAQLLSLRRQYPQGRLIAGATEVGLEITKKFKRLPILISVEGVAELREITSTDTHWRIGAAATLTQIEEKLAAEYPALGDMLRVFGSRQIRNRATMGGNLATASPIGDSAPVLLALDASVVLAAAEGERTLPIDQFFTAYRQTALRPGEVLKTILLPRGPSASGLARQCAWFKVSKRREMDISTVAACFTVDLDREGIVRHVRLAYGGVAATSIRARATEQALLGKSWSAETIQAVLPVLRGEFTPITDVRGSAAYRSGLVPALLEKFFAESPESDTSDMSDTSDASDTSHPASPPHESAHLHVTGAADYTDDQAADKGGLEVWPVCSPHARARILKRDAGAARQMPGIHAVLLAEDVPGLNDVGAVNKDEILLADKEVSFHGQIIALVAGESQEACRAAAAKVIVDYEPLPPVLTLREALASGSFHNEPNFIRRGDVEKALAQSPRTLQGEFELGGQEHFYLEMQAAWAAPGGDGSVHVTSATQHPAEVQNVIAHVLRMPACNVVVQVPRMGGGFGGKETQAATPAALAALAAWKTGRPVRVHWNRDLDMMLTGHRHPFLARFNIGFDSDGRLLAAKIHLWSNGGWSRDLSQAVTDRALFHLDNCYYIPAAEFRGQVAKTNLSSNTAMRGFGGPQGMVIIEEIIDRVARETGLPPEVVRERNLYHGGGETNTTHYGQPIGDNRIGIIWRELKESSGWERRRGEIAAWNNAHPRAKRGLAMTPLKFGISFTVTHLNQAGAFVLLYVDGSAQVNHGGAEMGQGLHTNIRAIAARELGIKPEDIRIMPTSTDKVPNTSATAASVGTDVNGAAVKNACETLRARLLPLAVVLFKEKFRQNAAPEDLLFTEGEILMRGKEEPRLPLAEVLRRAWQERVSLSATGFYATSGIHWDRAAGRGKPFHYFACGAAVAEVEVDGYTGMQRVLRVDILHDAGAAINEGISAGQVEGGFAQGMGWLTGEELLWDKEGRLLTHCPDTYKIPSIGDTPLVFNVTLLKNAAQKDVVYGSKAVGEPPLMLAISVREAIRDAVAAFGPPNGQTPLAVPATPEAIWTAIQQRASGIS